MGPAAGRPPIAVLAVVLAYAGWRAAEVGLLPVGLLGPGGPPPPPPPPDVGAALGRGEPEGSPAWLEA
eukprot:1520089-Pyramimonas_sp.AAC.1